MFTWLNLLMDDGHFGYIIKIEKNKIILIQTLLFSNNCGYPLPIHGVKINLAHTNVWNLFIYVTHFVLKALQY